MLQPSSNKRTMMMKLLATFQICMLFIADSLAQDIVGCGGFVQSSVPLNFERVEVKLYTKQGALKFKTECAPNNGYFLVAVYDKVGFESLDGSKLFCPQQDTFLCKMYKDLNVCSLCSPIWKAG
eukprot:Seg2301.10 transcript_id=Seg2301.10/GoldUCD/mRNA.D3Y31 product="Nodal modulator 1" protein_id=Seg2301.10/GoldUCD/D3Y31